MSDSVLSHKQQKAIVALLSERTLEGAALIAKVTPRTLRRWLALPDFRRELTQAETSLTQDVIRGMVSDMQENRDVIIKIRDGAAKDETSLRAAIALDNSLLRWRELGLLDDIEKRLSALEDSNVRNK